MTARTPRALARLATRVAAATALAVVAAALVAGCSMSRPATVKNMFLLEPPAPPAAAKARAGTCA